MRNVDLLNGPIDSSLRKFSLPLAVSFLIHMLYAWVDMYYVSKLGSEAIAAVGVGERKRPLHGLTGNLVKPSFGLERTFGGGEDFFPAVPIF